MKAMLYGLFLCLFWGLTGCGLATTDLESAREGADFKMSEVERSPDECALLYKDLQESYLALLERTDKLHSYRDELGGFIHEYSAVREKQGILAAENKNLRAENDSLKLSTRDLQGRIEVLDAKLKLVRDTVSHLVSSMHDKSPVVFANLKTNPMTDGIVLDDALMFSAGQSELTGEGRELLESLAQTLNRADYKDFLVRVDGHTDNSPVSKTKKINIDNWFLGARRAHAVLRYLAESGVAPERLSLASFGSTQPIVHGSSGNGISSQNRRVEIVLLQKRESI